MKQRDITFSSSIVRSALKKKKTILSDDLSSDKFFKDKKSIKRLNIISFICVPMIIPGNTEPFGTLYIDQRIHQKIFNTSDVAFLENFANLAAIAIKNASSLEKLEEENIKLRKEIYQKYNFPEIIGKSDEMQKVFYSIQKILNDSCPVLLTGESGVGKEVIAKAIHYNSNRKTKPFIAVNCGALPENLLEVELFGSVKGAFSGAEEKKGLFHAAQGGTLLLDEINHTSEKIQIKLLRILQDKKVRRLGETNQHSVDFRLICATNEDLATMTDQGNFRKDFLYRINVVNLFIPPLRDRKEDIPILANYFLKKYSKEKNRKCYLIEPDAIKALRNYPWKENNVRELEHEIETALIFKEDNCPLKISDLSEKITSFTESNQLIDNNFNHFVLRSYQEFEKEYLQYVLSQTGGNKTRAASILEIPRSTLMGKLRKLGIK